MFAKVIVDIAHAAVDRAFTYRIPDGLDVRLGHHVLVPFGQGDHVKEGFVLSVMEKSDLEEGVALKDVLSCMEPYTVLLPEQIELAQWMKEAYHCLLVDALRLMIPAQLRGGRIHEKKERIVYLADPSDEFVSRSHIQTDVVELLKKTGQPMSIQDIKAFLPGAAPAIAALLKKRVLSESSFTVFRRPEYSSRTEQIPELTQEQTTALQEMEALSPGQTALLYGVTGSGKTEVYLRCIETCLEQGKGAIVLVPELALTPQTVGRVAARFGDRIAVLHSRLSAGERFDEWRRIRLGRAPIVIGARREGSWDLRLRPSCNTPKPSRMIPTARIRPKMKSLSLFTTAMGSPSANAVEAKAKVSTRTQNRANRVRIVLFRFILSFPPIRFQDRYIVQRSQSRRLCRTGYRDRLSPCGYRADTRR